MAPPTDMGYETKGYETNFVTSSPARTALSPAIKIKTNVS